MIKNKPIYRKWWFWAIMGAVVVNVACALVFSEAYLANIFTAISGWVSAFAAVIVGAIAIDVSEKLSKQQNAIGLFGIRYNAVLELKKLLRGYKVPDSIVSIYDSQKNGYAKGLNFRDFYINFLPHNEKPSPFGAFDAIDEYICFLTLAAKVFNEEVKAELLSFIDVFAMLQKAILESFQRNADEEYTDLKKAIVNYSCASTEVEKTLAKMQLIIEESYTKGIK